MLLTEHGQVTAGTWHLAQPGTTWPPQVYTWGGGSRGQLGHGGLGSEESPRLVMALDGMKIVKIAAGGWHR